jgi:lycopene beta-cyclase
VPAEQAAYGVIVDAGRAAGLLPAGEALFMDWRPDHGEAGPPTFLYAIPLGDGAVLLEETSLARRPGLPMPVLRRRLLARLARHGVDPDGGSDERVLFRLDTPHHRADGVLGFGAAAPLVHPASGFSLATSLTLAPRVARALAAGLARGTDAALAAADAVLWPPAARAVHRFRRVGLEALLRMPPAQVPDFFELFFGLPERQRWAYLTGRADLRGATATMGTLFRHADWALRARLVLPALRRPAPPTRTTVGRPGR